MGKAWQERARLDPPEAAVVAPGPGALNTGILCDGLRPVDSDIDDPVKARQVDALAEQILGPTLVRRRAGSPRPLRLYRAAEGEPSKREIVGAAHKPNSEAHGCKVEVLGRGQQFVADGRHESGAQLTWSPIGPAGYDRAFLPTVTEEQVLAFLIAAAAIIGAPPPDGGSGTGNRAEAAPTPEELLATDPDALAAIVSAMPNGREFDDRNEWVKLAHGVAAAFANTPERARELWLEHADKRPQTPGEAEEVWDTLGDAHRTGEAWILAKAKACGVDVSACKVLRDERLAAAAFAAVPLNDAGKGSVGAADPDLLAQPDMGVLRLHRRAPPTLPLDVFGPAWRRWIEAAAEAAGCPPDYVVAPLIASVSALIGNARWAQATPGWAEPPHLWCASVGESGNGKSPGGDALFRHVLPVIERRMAADFPNRLREWRAAAEWHGAAHERWKSDVRTAQKGNLPLPLPPSDEPPPEPQAPRLRQSDVTIERVATLLATAAPKGLLIVRDELAGWLQGMNNYHDAGRAFWIEAYGGRPYRVERQKHPQPIDVPYLAVAVAGGTQPDKLAALMREADDGLLSRLCWFWPEGLPFRLGRASSAAVWAEQALDRLRLLEMAPGAEPGAPPRPVMVPLADAAVSQLEGFGCEMQEQQKGAGGLMCSALGKARGTALRLSLVIEMLWWCGEDGMITPLPTTISKGALLASVTLVRDYFMPTAERVYGDAATAPVDRNAATLARWIIKSRPAEVHVRHVQRRVRLSGLGDAEAIHAACRELVAAGWLIPPASSGSAGRPKAAYPINPLILEAPM